VDLNLQGAYQSSAVALTEMSFFNLLTTVNKYNNVIQISENNGAQTLNVVLDQKSFSAPDFASYLSTLLSISSPSSITYTVTYDAITLKFNFASDGLNFKFTPSTTCRKLLGFSSYSIATQIYTTDQVSDIPINLSGPAFCYVCTSLTTRNLSSNGFLNVLAKVPISAQYGSQVVYEAPSPLFCQIGDVDIDNLQILLRDDNGDLLQLPTETDVSFTFAFRFR
jgi:hypothetical protein